MLIKLFATTLAIIGIIVGVYIINKINTLLK